MLARKILHRHWSQKNFSHASEMVARMVAIAQHFLGYERRRIRLDNLRWLLHHHAALRHQHVSDKENVKWDKLHKLNLPLRRQQTATIKLLKANCITCMIFRYDHKLSFFLQCHCLLPVVALEQNIVGVLKKFFIFQIFFFFSIKNYAFSHNLFRTCGLLLLPTER